MPPRASASKELAVLTESGTVVDDGHCCRPEEILRPYGRMRCGAPAPLAQDDTQPWLKILCGCDSLAVLTLSMTSKRVYFVHGAERGLTLRCH